MSTRYWKFPAGYATIYWNHILIRKVGTSMPLDPSRPLLFDGAFGTYYYSLTGDEAPCELANLTSPDTVLRIHREYLARCV